jgi:hypothetical protein
MRASILRRWLLAPSLRACEHSGVTVSELKPYQDKIVVLHLKDGEIATAKVLFVDAEYEDIIVDIIATNRHYKNKGPANPAYTISVAVLTSVREISR